MLPSEAGGTIKVRYAKNGNNIVDCISASLNGWDIDVLFLPGETPDEEGRWTWMAEQMNGRPERDQYPSWRAYGEAVSEWRAAHWDSAVYKRFPWVTEAAQRLIEIHDGLPETSSSHKGSKEVTW